jgi:ABC-type sugar transport system ATPase subunit
VCTLSPRHLGAMKNYGRKKILFGMRPEDIEITKDRKGKNSFQCKIHFKQSLGVEDILNMMVGDTVFRAISPPKIMAQVGETLYATFNMERAHLFDPVSNKRIEV